MTREEAIKMLEYIKHIGNGESEYKNDAQAIAIDMAIKALEQVPCEDAISRQAVLGSNFDDDTEYTGSEICSMVHNLPSVNPQQRIGHWVIMDDCERFIAKCSECGRIEDSRMISKYPYCHCGAKMVDQQESEG